MKKFLIALSLLLSACGRADCGSVFADIGEYDTSQVEVEITYDNSFYDDVDSYNYDYEYGYEDEYLTSEVDSILYDE